VQTHPTLPLFIHNYSEKTQFDKRWDEVTMSCRGLILDNNGDVIARPWKKFFNYGEGRLKIDDVMPVEVTDKMDGSLGILYPRMVIGLSLPEDRLHPTRPSTQQRSGRTATMLRLLLTRITPSSLRLSSLRTESF
jgi:hypothetical protein